MELLRLKNDLNIVLRCMPNTHSITFGLYIKAGQFNGEPTVGITHLLEHLHFRQLGSMTQEALYYKMESMGSTLRAVTYRDFLKFSMKVVPCFFDGCLEIFLKLFSAVEWSEDSFLKEKKVVLNQIEDSEHFDLWDKAVRQTVFKGCSLENDIMGNKKQIGAITLEQVTEYKKNIFNPSGLLLCLTGNFTDEQKRKLIECFQNVKLSQVAVCGGKPFPKDFCNRNKVIRFVPYQGSGIVDVNISFDISYKKEDRGILALLNCILGEGVGSRLQRLLREEKGYLSDISSYIEWYEHIAVLHIVFSVGEKRLFKCIKWTVAILNDLKKHVTPNDLAVSLPFYTLNSVFDEDDTEEMNFQVGYNLLVFKESCKTLELQNDEDTALKIKKAAQNIFKKKNLCIVIGGNIEKLDKAKMYDIVETLG